MKEEKYLIIQKSGILVKEPKRSKEALKMNLTMVMMMRKETSK